MGKLYSINFQIVPEAKAVVSVMDRSFLYGDSVYEVIRTYQGTVPFLMDRHYKRLLNSAEKIGLTIPFSLEKLAEHIQELVRTAKNSDSYIRLVVSRGTDTRFSLLPLDGAVQTTVLYVDEMPRFPKSYISDGIPVALVSVRRNLRTALDPSLKTGNYLNNMIALMEANRAKAVEAIMLNSDGLVTEATTSNVFIVKNGVLMTPEMQSGLLEGVTRGLLKEIVSREKIPFAEKKISEEEFLKCDEAFISGTIKEIMPISTVNGRPVGSGKPGPLTRKVMEYFQSEVKRLTD